MNLKQLRNDLILQLQRLTGSTDITTALTARRIVVAGAPSRTQLYTLASRASAQVVLMSGAPSGVTVWIGDSSVTYGPPDTGTGFPLVSYNGQPVSVDIGFINGVNALYATTETANSGCNLYLLGALWTKV